jgi:2-polyprenyl-6-methoxyphenol hydroxylase-like FAD-dependent oxidoreductase
MKYPVRSVLVVGGGIAGMSTALVLRRLGLSVDLVEIDPRWRVYGAGITLTGPTLRAFAKLGIYDELAVAGYMGDGIRVCSMSGSILEEIETPRPLDANVPGSGGVLRPALHGILSSRTRESGTKVTLGASVSALNADASGVLALFTDGRKQRFDLVVGADGLFSTVRKLIFPQAPPPHYLGQTIWRLIVPRPPQIDRRHYFLGGPVKVGLCPVSRDEMYLFLLENRLEPVKLAESLLSSALVELLQGYGGILADIRASISSDARIVMRPLEGFLLPPPWYRDGVVLLGDAAHPTTPQLASGAGMATEDALVLGEELARGGNCDAVLERLFMRRYERCRLVVANSLEIGRREREGASVQAQTELISTSLSVLAQPY